jgi:predicted ATPase
MDFSKDKSTNLLSRIDKRAMNSSIVVLGQNGQGKSRLLVNLIAHAKNYNYDNVIAVSTSPFDKFPLRKEFKGTKYKYIGVKGGNAGNSILSLISSASLGLLDYKKNDENGIEKILQFLGASSEVEYIFKLNPNHTKIFKRKSLFSGYIYSIQDKGIEEKIIDCSEDEYDLIETYIQLLERSIDSNKNFKVRLRLGEIAYIRNQFERNYDINEIITLLLKFELIKLIDFRIEKLDFGWMSLRLASSGEQCILLSLLGITANISDNTLILIDEPEISLHPEWQERYISLLMTIFRKYKYCLFVIATHSPQMISKLSPKGSYIYTIQNNELLNAYEYIRKSSDFQLANLFEAPGFKNEYLTRVLISFLTDPSLYLKDGKVTEINNILSLKKNIEVTDPVYKLMDIAQKVLVRLS